MENQKQNNKNSNKQEEDEEYYKNVIGSMIDKYGGSSPDEDNNDYEDQEFSDSNKKNRNVNRSSYDNPENQDYHEQSNQEENFMHSENQEYNDYDAQQLENQDNEEMEAYNDEENMNSEENNHPRYSNYDDGEYIDEQNEQFHNNYNESNQNKDNNENDEEYMNQQYQHQMNNEDFDEEENNQDLDERNMNTNRIDNHASNVNNRNNINKNYNQLMEYDDNQEYYDNMNNEDNDEMQNPENNDDQELNDNNQYELNRNNFENNNDMNDNEMYEEDMDDMNINDMNDMDNVDLNNHEENEHNEYSEEEGNKSNYIQDENLEELADGSNINNQFTTNIRNNNIPSNSSNNNTVIPVSNKVKSHNNNKNLNIDLEEENPSSQDLARNINPEYQIYNNNSKNNKQQHINKLTHGNHNHNYNEEMNINNEEQEINEISDSKNNNNNYSNEDNLLYENNEFTDRINNEEYNEENNNYNNEDNEIKENNENENENDDNINNEENNINNEEEDYNDNEKEEFKNKEEDNDIENNDNYDNNDVNNNDNDDDNQINDEDINESHQSQNNIDFENLNLKVKKIFEFYASFGNRLNIETLGSTKYFKFAVDAGLLNNFAQQSQIKSNKSKNNNNSSNKAVNIVSKSKIDIIFSQLTSKSSKMNLEAFTKSLVLLSDEYYHYYTNNNNNNNNNTDTDINNDKFFSKTEKNQNKKKKLIVFVENILFPLYDNLFNKNKNNIDNSIIEESPEIINDNFTLNDDLIKLLESSGVCLYSIYKTYFKHELSLSQNSKFLQKTSYNQYCSFIKDFDICPTLINKSICITSYLHLEAVNINSEEAYFNVIKNVNFGKIVNVNPNCSNILGSYFTFFKFIRILVKLSLAMFESIETNINKNSNKNDNSASPNVRINLFEKVLYLLEKMESSYGFCNLEKKTHITHTSKTNYIYDRKTVSYLKQKQFQNNNQNNLDHCVNNYYGLNNNSSVLPDKMLKITSNSNIRVTSPGLYSNQTTNVNSPQPLSHINTERNESENNRLTPDDLKYNPNHTEFNIRTTNNQYNNTQEKLDVNNYDFSSSNPIIEFINESYGSVLLQIFEAYCSFGSDSQETKLMKSTNFNKFLKESELISDNSISKSKLSYSNSTNSKLNIRSKNVNYNQLNTNSNSNNKSGRPIFQLSHNDNRSKNYNNTLKQSNNKKEENVNPEFNQEKYLILSDIKLKTNEIDILFTSLLKLMSKEEKNSNNSNNNTSTSNYNNSKYSNKLSSSYYYNSYHDSTKSTVKARTKGINFKAFINSLVLLSNHIINIYSKCISRIRNDNIDNNNEDSLQLDIIDVINFVIQEKIFKSNQKLLIKHFESDEKIELLEALKSESEEDVNLLNILSASLEHIYFYYTCNKDSKNSKTRGLMTSLQLLSFASDFNIFPDILSKSKLLYYFKKKALEIQQDVINKLGIYDIELIDFSGFIDFIGLIAIELPMEDEPFYNRVNTIIEHLNQSRGEEKIYKRNHIKQIPLVVLFKQKIPEYLKQGDKSISVNGFYDILEV